jgi:hypothetical protein
LFYFSGDQKLMAVEVTTSPEFKAGIPGALFQAIMRSAGTFKWDVSADGKRFLIATTNSAAADEPITMVTNWQAELKK